MSPLNPIDRENLRQELLELHFGCHANPEVLEARLRADAEVRALYDEVKAAAAVLSLAAQAPAGEAAFVPPEPEAGDRPSDRAIEKPAAPAIRRTWPALRAAAGILIAILVAGPGVLWTSDRIELSAQEEKLARLEVAGPTRALEGVPARFSVVARNGRDEPMATSIGWRVLARGGHVLEENMVGSGGTAPISVPTDLPDPSQVLFFVQGSEGTIQAETAVPFPAVEKASPPLVHLSVDKPAYQPGETVHWRLVFLDRLSLSAAPGQIRARIVDAQGTERQPYTVPLDDGVASGAWPISADTAGGTYALEVRDAAGAFTVERLEFLVNRYEPPKLAKKIELDRETYGPGEKGRAEILVTRAEGGAAAQAKADASLVIDGEVKWTGAAALDAAGRAVFDFEVPAEVAKGEARVSIRISDGAIVETAVKPFVVPTGRLAVAFYPEGGDLPAGLESRVYAEVTDALGRPADAKGRILDAEGRTVARFETLHQGRARFDLTAQDGASYRLLIEEPSGTPPIDLPAPKSGAVALRTKSESTPAGRTVGMIIEVPHNGPWLVSACCRGVPVAHATLRGRGRHEVALDPGDGVAGVLRITVFDALYKPVAERLVRRESGRDLRVEIKPANSVLAPGTRQEVEVVVQDESGKPVRAILGLCAADTAVRAMTEDHRVGLADRAWFVADAEELERVEEFLAADAESERNIDLVLGTRGWRRFRWNDSTAFAAEHGDKARRRQALEARASFPIVVSSSGGPGAGLSDLRSRVARDARLWLGGAGLAAMFAALVFWRRTSSDAPAIAAMRIRRMALATIGVVVVLATLHLTSYEADSSRFITMCRRLPSGVPEFESMAPPTVAWMPETFTGWKDGLTIWRSLADQQVFLGLNLNVPQPEVRLALPLASILSPSAGVFYDKTTLLGLPDTVASLERLEEHTMHLFEALPIQEHKHEGFVDHWQLFLKEPRGGWTREYAHQHRAGPIRTDFAESIYWNALLRTDDAGKAKVAFDLSDRVTTWEVWADAHGSGRLGQGRSTFEARLPFRLEPSLPSEVTEGDTLLIPVGVIGEISTLAQATVAATVGGPLRLKGDASAMVPLQDGRGRWLIEVEVTSGKGGGSLLLAGTYDRWTDSVGKPIRIVPRGFPRRWSRSGVAREFAEIVVPAPESVIPGSARCALKLYPSPLATLGDGVEGLLGEPGGCFEQVSSTNYPNVLALTLMQATGDGSPSVSARAKDLLAKGYRMLTGYECKGGGFEWFGNGDGHTGLTAYGLAEFHDMARVHDIDRAMMDRTRKWLLSKRDGQGGYRHTSGGLHTFGRVGAATQDVYVTWALLEAGTEASELKSELDALARRATKTDDSYELAVAACALHQAGRTEAAAGARKRLQSLQDEKGFIAGAKTSLTDSGGNDLLVETTGFAVLAWLADPADRAHVDRAMHWLMEQRQGAGTFGTTQATVMALKAIVACAETSRPAAPGGDVVVLVNGTEVRRLAIDPKGCQVLKIEALEELLNAGGNTVRIELPEKGELPYVLDFNYTSDLPADDPECRVGITTALAAAEVEEGAPLAIQVEVTNRTAEALPMVLAVVGLPASLTISDKVLDALKDAGRFDHWEQRGRDIVLYWRTLAAFEVETLTLDTIATLPGQTTGPASRASLYYTPDSVSWTAGLPIRCRAR